MPEKKISSPSRVSSRWPQRAAFLVFAGLVALMILAWFDRKTGIDPTAERMSPKFERRPARAGDPPQTPPAPARDLLQLLSRLVNEAAPGDDGELPAALVAAATRDPGGLVELISETFPPPHQIDALALALGALSRTGHPALANRALVRLADHGMQAGVIERMTAPWARENPAAAAAWLVGLPPDLERTTAFQVLGRVWAETEPRFAAEFARGLPPGEFRQAAFTGAVTAWVSRDPAAASVWLNQVDPHPDFDPAAAAIARIPALVICRPDVALGWAESVVNESQRQQSLAIILGSWAERDPAAALRYVQNSPALNSAQRRVIAEDLNLTVPLN